MILSIIPCAHWLLLKLQWNVCSSSLSIFQLRYWAFCCWVVGVLGIFCILCLYQKCDLLIFSSHPVVFLFTFLTMYFDIQRFAILRKSNIPFFSFVAYHCSVIHGKQLPYQRSRLFPTFYNSYMFLPTIFWSPTIFCWFLYMLWRRCLTSIFHVDILLSQHHLLNSSFPINWT